MSFYIGSYVGCYIGCYIGRHRIRRSREDIGRPTELPRTRFLIQLLHENDRFVHRPARMHPGAQSQPQLPADPAA